MQDPANQWLLSRILNSSKAEIIWFADENFTQTELDSLSKAAIAHPVGFRIVTNRSDLANHLSRRNFNASFSDFDTSSIRTRSIDQIFFRVSKEKSLSHHVINLASDLLKSNGILTLVGYKKDGIKTYIEKACDLLGASEKSIKQGPFYFADIPITNLYASKLPADNYTEIRKTFNLGDRAIYSKPGQFGWNKIDAGSQLLADQLLKYLQPKVKATNQSFKNLLDLGCGYGYLSMLAVQLPIKQFTLTDNNAAALRCAATNMKQFNVEYRVVASDAGDSINEKFDLIVCNPPFHQGFAVDTDLTEKFLTNTARLLAGNGKAFYVVNQFIPLENKAEGKGFSSIKTLLVQNGFKVILLEKNR